MPGSRKVHVLSEVSAELREALAGELRRLAANVPAALAEISLPIYVLDREGTIRWENATSLDLFGDRRGEHFTAVVAPEAQQDAKEQFARKLVGGARTTSYDSVFVARGQQFEAEVETVRLEHGAEAVGVFGILELKEMAEPKPSPEVHLTPRQLQVLKLLASGSSTDSIAASLHLSRETVRNHVRDLLKALGVHSRVAAIVRGRELGIV